MVDPYYEPLSWFMIPALILTLIIITTADVCHALLIIADLIISTPLPISSSLNYILFYYEIKLSLILETFVKIKL